MDEQRKKILATALSQIEKQFGKGSIMRLGDTGTVRNIEVIPTGSLGLDLALGVGGLPRGRVVEIFGPESSGKTTLTLHFIAETQKLGGAAAFIDAEHALDLQYAEKLGVNIQELLVSQPDTGEQALEIADLLVRSGAIDLVVVDSVAALTPKAEIEGEMGDTHVGLQARLMSQALRKLAANIRRSNAIVVFINQIRMKIGVMFGCFDYRARVVLADGTTAPIGEIVSRRLPVEVLSFDPATGTFAPRPVVNWFCNGDTDAWLHFEVGTGWHRRRFSCTANHLVFTPTGPRPAGELNVGDAVMTAVPRSARHAVEHWMTRALAPFRAPRRAALSWAARCNGARAVARVPSLGSDFGGGAEDGAFQSVAEAFAAMPVPIVRKERRPARPDQRARFDLEVAGQHSYLVDRVAVHNSPETTTGGNALKFYASVRLDIRRTGSIKKGEDIVGNETKVKVVKNKVAPPFKQANFDILYGEGISRESELLDLGVERGVIEKAGTWYSYGGSRIGQGKENARGFLRDNLELATEIMHRIRAAALPPAPDAPLTVATTDDED